MAKRRICVVGAGSSGLAAIKSCKEEDLDVTCFEKDDDVGGLWRYRESDDEGKPSVMKSTIINTSKESSAFSDFPFPKEYPNYMHNTLLFKYFEMYAKNFDLSRHIMFLHEVLKVERNEDYAHTGRWMVTVKDAEGLSRSEVFDGVMICAGHHIYPNIPTLKGLNDFQGKVHHTHSLKTSKGFEDLRILVMGIGNSAVDAAVELSQVAKKVYLSTRKGSWIAPRVSYKGRPLDIIGNRRIFTLALNWSVFKIVDRVVELYLNSIFDHEKFKLKPKHHVFSAHPTINDTLPNSILSGRVVVKQDVDYFQKNGVVFQGEDNTTTIDAVILATGYHIKFSFLGENILQINDNRLKLYKLMFPPNLEYSTLAFIGLIQPLGAIFPIAEAQSRWFAFMMNNNMKLPSKVNMDKEIESRTRANEELYVASPRHTIQVHFINYMDEICSQFGAKPNLSWLALTDPKLFWACWFKPCSPYQYRINGPHSWPGARNAILTIDERIQAPLDTRRSSDDVDS